MREYLAAVVLLAGPLISYSQTVSLVEQGKPIYRSNCAFCHGIDGKGGRGPDLTSPRRTHGDTEDAVRGIIRNGIPGTVMSAFSFDDADLGRLLAFLVQLRGTAGTHQPLAGDPRQGAAVYARSGCAACHRIGSEGSVYGPDLTRIGAGRSPDYIRQSLLAPSADIPGEWEGVTVVARDGQKVTGVRVNEDTFSVQLREPSARFRMFQKSGVRDVIHEKQSLMPSYSTLSKDDLQNLLAYLDGLRGETK